MAALQVQMRRKRFLEVKIRFYILVGLILAGVFVCFLPLQLAVREKRNGGTSNDISSLIKSSFFLQVAGKQEDPGTRSYFTANPSFCNVSQVPA